MTGHGAPSAATTARLIAFLTAHLATEPERLSLLRLAGFPMKLVEQINVHGSPRDFATHLLAVLLRFGEVAPGQPALKVFLDTIAGQGGVERPAEVAELWAEMQRTSRPPGDEASALSATPRLDIDEVLRVRGCTYLHPIGGGGFGLVHRVWNQTLHRDEAVKVIQSDTPRGHQEAVKEARILERARLPFVPLVYHVEHDVRHLVTFLFMQYVAGEPVDRSPAPPWPPAEVAAFLHTLLAHLQQIHALDIVHRDLTPRNILRDQQGRYWLIDFGLAKDGPASRSVHVQAHNLNYAPPEQAKGLPTDRRADLYSLGATAYRLLTGEHPPSARERSDGGIPLIMRAPAIGSVPTALAAMIERLMALDTAQRPATATAALALLSDTMEPAPPQEQGGVIARLEGTIATPARRPLLAAAPEPLLSRDVVAALAAVDPVRRAARFRDLAERGLDTRRGVGVRDSVPDIDWCLVLGGPCQVGDPPRPGPEAPFWIARYPVTNAQFAAFLAAGDGYANRDWWRDIRRPESPRKPRWAYSNHPCESVNWHEAVAFCRWLEARRQAGEVGLPADLPAGYEIHLPTEWEWEKAAAWDSVQLVQRVYPWGADWLTNKANTLESGIGQTSAVGIFTEGASPSGALDMAGNVWEWTDSVYEERGGGSPRVLRGGSWFNFSVNARAASRYRLDPDGRYLSLGFRVVVSSPIHHEQPVPATLSSVRAER